MFQEHEKRCWSVDFNKIDTKLVASGSDDSKVKLWSVNTPHSVATLEAKANICCVKFNPSTRNHLAFGSADHCVHYYDLRNVKVQTPTLPFLSTCLCLLIQSLFTLESTIFPSLMI